MSGNNHSHSNIHKSFQTPGVTITPAPNLTSFSTRKRSSGQDTATSPHSLLDPNFKTSSYQNRSAQAKAADRRSADEDESVELPPGMQETIANRYQQAFKKSSVIRIDARNFPTSTVSPSGSMKRRVSSSHVPPTSQDGRSTFPADRELMGRHQQSARAVRGPPMAKNHSANSLPREHRSQSITAMATPSLPGIRYSQNHENNVYSGTADSRKNIAQDATLQYSSRQNRFPPAGAKSVREPKNGFPVTMQDRGLNDTNSRNQGPRVTFASDKKEAQSSPTGKSIVKLNKEPSAKPMHTDGISDKNKVVKVSVADKDEIDKYGKRKRRNRMLLLVIFLLLVLLLITFALLVHFASKQSTKDKIQNPESDDQASETLPPETANAYPPRTSNATLYTKPPRVTRVQDSKVTRKPCTDKKCVMMAGNILSMMNLSVDPCEDFYKYSCGGWLSSRHIPVNYDQYGVTTKIADENDAVLYDLLIRPVITNKTLRTQKNISDAEEKAKIFYQSCIDTRAIEEAGAQPFLDEVAKTGGWDALRTWDRSLWKFTDQIYRNQAILSTSVFFSTDIIIDPDDDTKRIFFFGQIGVLTAEESSYYIYNGNLLEKVFKKSLRKALSLFGRNYNANVVDEIYSFEKQLAKVIIPPERIARMPLRKIKIKELEALCPQIEWFRILRRIAKSVGISRKTEVVIIKGTESFFRNLSSLINRTDDRTLHNYMSWRSLFSWSTRLSEDFRTIMPNLEYELIGFKKVATPRTQECMASTKQQFGLALGVMFIRETFSLKGKRKAEQIAEHVQQAFKLNLNELTWVDVSHHDSLIEKLNSMDKKIGFNEEVLRNPAVIDRMYQFDVKPEEFFNNFLNSVRWKVEATVKELANPVDTSRWSKPFFSWEAVYTEFEGRSEMTVPAGLLQQPLFDSNGPMALNFGAIGTMIAHEILHGFEFEWRDKLQVQQCVIRQYNGYVNKEVGASVNGDFTLEENIADMGGIKLAKKAYDLWAVNNQDRTRFDQPLPGIKLTNDQLFFVAFAQSWCKKRSFSSQVFQLRQRHSPENFRVIGSLSQYNNFADVFSCPIGSPMKSAHQCAVW